jgi:hypothetical protein
MATQFLSGNSKRRVHLADIGVVKILEKCVVKMWIRLNWFCENGAELSVHH